MHAGRNDLLAGGAVVAGLGALEDWYGRFDYAADAIAYLDLAKAFARGDWALAFSPYWSPGYPLILAATRRLFPAGPVGEWTAIHAVNLAVFLVVYLAFLQFLRAGCKYAAHVDDVPDQDSVPRAVFIAGTAIFLAGQLLVGNVSRVSPDLLLSGVFFSATALSLDFLRRPAGKTALLLGLLLGLGYLLKSVFLPMAVIVLVVMIIALFLRAHAHGWRLVLPLAWALPAMAVIVAPCIAITSRACGHFTVAETGALNYAWLVNGLPHWTDWQGGPAPCGTPLHPPRLMGRDPPVFAFATPFPVTYPPWFNPAYWYDGYHDFFDFRHQLAAIEANLGRLAGFAADGPHRAEKLLLEAAALLSAIFLLQERRAWFRRLAALWPLYVPSLAILGLYLLVIIEERYVIGFLIILAVAPVLALLAPTPLVARRSASTLAIFFAAGGFVLLAAGEREVESRALRAESWTANEQWKIGEWIRQAGFPAGTRVASVHQGGASCTWAYVGGVRITAEIGNDAFDPAGQATDFALFTDKPAAQQAALGLFRKAGAAAVIVPHAEKPPRGAGWEPVPGTQAWFYRLN